MAGTISGPVWCITVADSEIGVTPNGTPYTCGFEHTRDRRWDADGRGTTSTGGFEHTRHRRCAANGDGTTPNIRACAVAVAAPTTVAYHAADSATNGIRGTPTTACIKGEVSNGDAAVPSDIGARFYPSDDIATTTSYFSIYQATHRVITKSVTVITAAAAAAHSWPSLDSDTLRSKLHRRRRVGRKRQHH